MSAINLITTVDTIDIILDNMDKAIFMAEDIQASRHGYYKGTTEEAYSTKADMRESVHIEIALDYLAGIRKQLADMSQSLHSALKAV